jgi:uncharacterized phage protein gp47/JayE
MSFQKSFDELLNEILTDYRNQFPSADISAGSLIFIKSACLASALWGEYKYLGWIAKQIFPDTADTQQLEHHAWVRGITRTYGENDASLLSRLLDDIRRPPAGGNKFDYVKWAREVNNVARAWCYPIPGGALGHVDVVVLANSQTTGSEIPSSSARIGVVTSAASGKLVDSGATFTSGHAVVAGDIVENPLRQTRTTVASVDSATQISLNADIFPFAGEPYIIHCQTGTNTSAEVCKLIDSAGAFDDATYPVGVGDIVENVSDNKETTVVSVDSATQLTLAADIFSDTGKIYVVRSLVAEVKKHIDLLRPVTASRVNIIAPAALAQNVTMAVSGDNLDKSAIGAEISAYMAEMIPGQTLYIARLIQLAMDAGADNVLVSVPATDVEPTAYQMIRPGIITVN